MSGRFFLLFSLVFALAGALAAASFCFAGEDFLIGDDFAAPDGEGYWGPYGPAFTLKDGALVFDASVPEAWVTLNFKDDYLAPDAYRYVVIAIKTDDPADAAEVTMTLGNVGKPLSAWGLELTSGYTTHVLDLTEHGFTGWGTPDFALNKARAKDAKVYVDKLILTNNPPK